MPAGQGCGQQHTCLVHHLSQGYRQTFGNSSSIFLCVHLQFSHCKKLGAWARIILFHIKLQKPFFQKCQIQKRPKTKIKFMIAFTSVAKTAFKSVFHFLKYPNIQVNQWFFSESCAKNIHCLTEGFIFSDCTCWWENNW